jgi:hypothetical protein
MFDALHRFGLREYEQAEASAARALELAEKHHIPRPTPFSRFILGQARAQLGRMTEGIALIRRALAGLLEIGMRLTVHILWRPWRRHRNAKALSLTRLKRSNRGYRRIPKSFFFTGPKRSGSRRTVA